MHKLEMSLKWDYTVELKPTKPKAPNLKVLLLTEIFELFFNESLLFDFDLRL